MEAYVALVECVAVCAAMLVAACVDARTRTIPNACPIAIVAVHAVVIAVLSGGGADAAELACAALAGVLAGGAPLALTALVTDGVGGGDIKLMAALGFAVGWLRALAVLFLSCVFTVFVGLVAHLVKHHAKMQSRFLTTAVPMAPQIACSLAITFCLFPM